MKFLTAEQILFIHSRIISETGGSHGVRDLGLLEAAIARPKATFESKDLYLEVSSKAAALAHSLIKNHPFVDGNKRTGIAAAAVFLRQNGWRLTVSADNLETTVLNIVAGDGLIEDIAAWIRDNSIKL